MSCLKSLRAEFSWKNFGFEYDRVEEFYQAQGQQKERNFLYLLYRWIWASIFIAILATSLTLQFNGGKIFIYFTTWGVIMCAITQFTAAMLVTLWHFDVGDERTRVHRAVVKTPTSFKLKFYWLFYGITLHTALVISTVYWAFLHGKMNRPVRFPLLSIANHVLNSVLMLIDFLIVAFPLRLFHFIYTLIFAIAFCIFSLIYFFFEGEDEYGNGYIYPILDWTYPTLGAYTVIGISCLFVVYGFLVFTLYKCKCAVKSLFNITWNPHAVGLL